MSKFLDDLTRFVKKAEANAQAMLVGSVAEVRNSIVLGSDVTGAPGQVVADKHGGALRDSWQVEWQGPSQALISTKIPYAESNEDGIARPGGGPYVQRSTIGGRWSVALTRAGFTALVEDVKRSLGLD